MKLVKFTLLFLIVALASCAMGPQTQLERERERLQVRLWEQCMKVNSEKHKQNFDAAAYFDACYDWSRRQSKATFHSTRNPYPQDFRDKMVELVRSGCTPSKLAKDWDPIR